MFRDGIPELWCFDLGKIKRFIPDGIPENDNDPLPNDYGSVETESGIYNYGLLDKKSIARLMGYDAIVRYVPYNKKQKTLFIPDEANSGYRINPKDFDGHVVYHGENIETYCNDPRFLAIINLQLDAMNERVPYKKVRKIFERVPTKEAALAYLEKNGFAYGEPLDPRQYQRIPFEVIAATMDKIGDYQPLLDGLER